ncbi:nidogen [Culicoides brevitarsis]|uniref:nidogen n=1 Tax=Culicoides brevitarsis TaxID=469753 RepID=UPI00307BCD28
MNLKLLIFQIFLLIGAHAISVEELYESHDHLSVLPKGDSSYEYVKLNVPVHLYSEKYDVVYINTNGLLSFRSEYPQFVNVPFPLEVPAIAPFYSNVDTSAYNDASLVSYYQTHDPILLGRAETLVRQSFSDALDFKAESLFIATWKNVGHYNQKTEQTNTFQVILICGQEETYTQFLYPRNGINWIQGETGDSGLPDIRAQAGFVSEDLRHYLLKDSGSDNIRHITEGSNVNNPGEWIFRTGPLGQTDNITEPDLFKFSYEKREPTSCATGGNFKCHSMATCKDTNTGFCCVCRENYYGDGLICIKNDAPLRVSGTITGSVGGVNIGSVALQSYVVMAEGRTYTALSPLDENTGLKLQLAQTIGNTIGWLFAKPTKPSKNGFQLTGGKFNSSITLRFDETQQTFNIKQTYTGLNVWDQLASEVEVSGDLPDIPRDAKITIDDFTDEFTLNGDMLSSVSRHKLHAGEQEINFSVFQEIKFQKCKYADSDDSDVLSSKLKSTRNTINYDSREKAVRIGAINKVGQTSGLNPCEDGSYRCGANTVCVSSSEDNYDCVCQNGFTYPRDSDERGVTDCVDIDECNSGYSTCSENARCINELGSFRCECLPGFDGNGYQCDPLVHRPSRPPYPTTRPRYEPDYPDVTQRRPNEHLYPDETEDRRDQPCQGCSPHAACVNGQCRCNFGYNGDGITCQYNCPYDLVWNGNNCEQLSQPEEFETEPYCTITGCECPAGYQLIDLGTREVCHLEDSDSDDQSNQGVACDIENNCSAYASCQWNDISSKYECICNPGYHGDGIDCREKEVSCVEHDSCDEHAQCVYNEKLRTSTCVCDQGYEGDGKYCHVMAECNSNEDCGHNSHCSDGICICDAGFERDLSDFCVKTGSCDGAYCAENAICKWDPTEKVKYCHCPEGFVGDGIRTCKSIPPPCNVRNNCGLYASCVPNERHQYECRCDTGYDGDGFVCNPERNCRNYPEICDRNADCESYGATWRCVCRNGFLGNGSKCNEVVRVEKGFLFYSQGVALVRIPFNGRQGLPVAITKMAIGVDKDCAEGRLYYSDITGKSLSSVGYDGLAPKVFLNEDIVSPEGVAVDWISRRIYWTDSGKDTIEVASLDDASKRAVLVNKNLVNPRGIAVDPGKYLFWSDWDRDGPKIEYSNLDGTNRQVLLKSPDVILPNSLVISPTTGELCWADAGTKRIDCVDVYSKVPRNVAKNLSYPFGLAATDEHFYWTDWTTKKIEAIDLYGNRLQGFNSPIFGSHKMYGAVAVTERCEHYHTPCTRIPNGGCPDDRICLTNHFAPSGISCKCIDNKVCNEAAGDYII